MARRCVVSGRALSDDEPAVALHAEWEGTPRVFWASREALRRVADATATAPSGAATEEFVVCTGRGGGIQAVPGVPLTQARLVHNPAALRQ